MRPPTSPYLQRELRHKGVTLQPLWDEYRETDPDGYGYSQFCNLYRKWRGRFDVVKWAMSAHRAALLVHVG